MLQLTLLKKHHNEPFYLHVAYYAPHVPLESTEKYLKRFSDISIQRRKYALAMMSAVDDGVGQILHTLAKYDIDDNTIVFFISDNGAPLGLDMTDAPITDHHETWDGSMNTPLVGEKGMLTEGGIRVPYVMKWPEKVSSGIVLHKPVSSLDATFTVLKAAGASNETLSHLDGVDLMPALTGNSKIFRRKSTFLAFLESKCSASRKMEIY